jgi:hypothetical protein
LHGRRQQFELPRRLQDRTNGGLLKKSDQGVPEGGRLVLHGGRGEVDVGAQEFIATVLTRTIAANIVRRGERTVKTQGAGLTVKVHI